VLIPADVSLHEELECTTKYFVEDKRGHTSGHIVLDTSTATERDEQFIDGWVMDQLEDNGIHDPDTIQYSIHVTYTEKKEVSDD